MRITSPLRSSMRAELARRFAEAFGSDHERVLRLLESDAVLLTTRERSRRMMTILREVGVDAEILRTERAPRRRGIPFVAVGAVGAALAAFATAAVLLLPPGSEAPHVPEATAAASGSSPERDASGGDVTLALLPPLTERAAADPASSEEALSSLTAGEIHALFAAASAGDVAALERALYAAGDGSVDVDARDAYGQTALMYALDHGRTDAARELLRAGADPDARSDAGWTPLMYAARAASEDAVALLLDAGADASARAWDGSTAVALVPSEAEGVRAVLRAHAGPVPAAQEAGGGVAPVDGSRTPQADAVGSRVVSPQVAPTAVRAPAVGAPGVQAPAVPAPAVPAPAVQTPAVQAPAVQAPAPRPTAGAAPRRVVSAPAPSTAELCLANWEACGTDDAELMVPDDFDRSALLARQNDARLLVQRCLEDWDDCRP